MTGAAVTPLEGQIAVVTGASGAIGGAVAAPLAAEGVHLLLSGRDARKLGALAKRLESAGTRVETFAADLADDAAGRPRPRPPARSTS